MQERRDSRDEGCKFGYEMALIIKDNSFNLTGTVFFSFDNTVSIRFA